MLGRREYSGASPPQLRRSKSESASGTGPRRWPQDSSPAAAAARTARLSAARSQLQSLRNEQEQQPAGSAAEACSSADERLTERSSPPLFAVQHELIEERQKPTEQHSVPTSQSPGGQPHAALANEALQEGLQDPDLGADPVKHAGGRVTEAARLCDTASASISASQTQPPPPAASTDNGQSDGSAARVAEAIIEEAASERAGQPSGGMPPKTMQQARAEMQARAEAAAAQHVSSLCGEHTPPCFSSSVSAYCHERGFWNILGVTLSAPQIMDGSVHVQLANMRLEEEEQRARRKAEAEAKLAYFRAADAAEDVAWAQLTAEK